MEARKINVFGEVKHVGFRGFVRKVLTRYPEATGYVWNIRGSVEILLQASSSEIETIWSVLESEIRGIFEISDIEVESVPYNSEYKNFQAVQLSKSTGNHVPAKGLEWPGADIYYLYSDRFSRWLKDQRRYPEKYPDEDKESFKKWQIDQGYEVVTFDMVP